MQRFGRRIDAAVGRAMHGQRADTHPRTQWAEAAFVPAAANTAGKSGIWRQDLAVLQGAGADVGREEKEHFSALAVLSLDDFVTGDESLPEQF
ncbi:hypothetical protein [Bradyrhizobium sp. WSM1743]|uniref:hypothetical protein n=1 Tax=Bradyrhizobium sp. WSM1743 TaxID=318996 RepID=UPI0004849C7F|nr:hypothetical protein [Bradyrhizobium sp. WSM1743]